MMRFLMLSISFLFFVNSTSQNKNFNEYSYVIVPDQFDFLNGKDKYQLNSMAKFYFEKNGFNAFMAEAAPNSNRCDGLFANVEELRTILGTKLQVVLKDCNDVEIYRGPEGKSKYKEFDKSYQDALRKAFSGIEGMHVKQKDIVLLSNADTPVLNETKAVPNFVAPSKKVSAHAGITLPDSKFATYSNAGKTYLLRKTTEGYSLYEESTNAENGLLLKGKVIVMDKVIKYLDTAGGSYDASFDPSGNLILKKDSSITVFKAEN